MATISLCMIVRDEAPVLGRCLASICKAVDEIILVDTGSLDRTREIAADFTDKIYDFPWVDDFAAARNFAFSKAQGDYQMWLDADDVVPPESADALLHLKEHLTADVVMMPYQVAFDPAGNPTLTYYRERLLRRACGFRWEGAVHEAITPAGEILYAEIPIEHRKLHVNDPDRNLRIFGQLLANGTSLSARERFYYSRELYYHERYADAAQSFRLFLDSDGWVEDKIQACLLLSKCEQHLGNADAARLALCRSFLMDVPRAEICCEIGRLCMEQSCWEQAIFWYTAAIHAPFPADGFQDGDCHDYIPYLQLCVCYDRLGNLPKAQAYNDKAGRIRPGDASVLANRAYFRNQDRRNV